MIQSPTLDNYKSRGRNAVVYPEVPTEEMATFTFHEHNDDRTTAVVNWGVLLNFTEGMIGFGDTVLGSLG